MLTAARLREYTGESAPLELFRDLGWPVVSVPVDPQEWKRGGVELPWNDGARLQLVARLGAFDLFLLTGNATREEVAQFLRSYKSYNLATKSALIYDAPESATIRVFDLSESGTLRRLDIDLARPSAHALDRLNLLACSDPAALPRIFDRALDREAVTRQFFQRFRGGVHEFAAAIRESCPDEDPALADGEALLVLSRLLFLSFVQEKGWLNGERRFLADRLDRAASEGRDLYSSVLAPLFFGCLNTPLHERTPAAHALGRIPYLNGGLFEPSSFERRNPGLRIPGRRLQQVYEDVFERFDFRTDERDAEGAHVDPEMLGKVFESLMAPAERSASGSFYTPREIVDALTGQALAEWLDGQPGNAAARLERLQSVTVIDPACGSGAFLLSALAAIEQTWRSLAGEAGVAVPRDVRRRIVSRCLYGVDLKPEAVRLCELRLWLAIVSDTDAAIEEIAPLPNLDRNILQGNSLLSPTDFLGDARTDIYGEWLQALRAQADLVERYRTAPHAHRPALNRIIRGNDQRLAAELLGRCVEHAERELQTATAPRRDLFGRALAPDAAVCSDLQSRLVELRGLLEKAEEGVLDFFSFDVHFAAVMAAGGFELVVGNPPWVRNARIEAAAKRRLADRYPLFRRGGTTRGFHQPDLSVAFFERSLQLASASGVVALLMPAKLTNAAYAAPLRRAALARHRLIALHDWSDDPRRRRWFEADTFPLGMVVARTRGDGCGTIEVTAAGESFPVSQRELGEAPGLGEWCLVPPEVGRILRRLRDAFPTLEQELGRRPFMGVKTGDNAAFFVEPLRFEAESLVTADGVTIPAAALCRCVRGRDLVRWRSANARWMLWPPPGGWREVPSWLRRHARSRGVAVDELQLAFVRPEHVGLKVAWKDLSRVMTAAVLPDMVSVGGFSVPLVPNQTLYAIDAVSAAECEVLCAIFNSTIAAALLISVAERAKDGHYRYFGATVGAMPLPAAGRARDALARIARNAPPGAAPSRELEDAVARIYGVSPSELRTLRDFVKRRTDARGASA
jgi:hypothetical protein